MNKYIQSMEPIQYQKLMNDILPSSLRQYLREDTYNYLVDIFTPDMEDNKTLKLSLSTHG